MCSQSQCESARTVSHTAPSDVRATQGRFHGLAFMPQQIDLTLIGSKGNSSLWVVIFRSTAAVNGQTTPDGAAGHVSCSSMLAR
jgi:hypothetical protein